MIEKDIRNQYVAVKDRKHIDNDVNLEAILKRLNLKNYDDSIAIEFINSKSWYYQPIGCLEHIFHLALLWLAAVALLLIRTHN